MSSLSNVRSKKAKAIISAAQDLTGAYADLGGVIDCRGYDKLGLYIDLDVNDSSTNTLRILPIKESDGTDEYEPLTATDYVYTLGDTDKKIFIPFDTDNRIPFIQIQVKAGTVGTTAGQIDAAEYIRG